MNNRIEWNENFELGIQEIDDQHKMLVTYLNALLADIETGINHTPEDIRKVISNASLFVEKHCKSEENLMLDIKYPYENYKAHYNAHSSFRIKLHNYEMMVIDESNWNEILKNFTEIVLGWIKAHETSADLKLVKFIDNVPKFVENL